MTQYLGICMVIIVTAMCIGILSSIVTGSILDEIEKVRKKRADRRTESWVKILTETGKLVTPMLEKAKEKAEEQKKEMEEMKKTVDDFNENLMKSNYRILNKDKIKEIDDVFKK